MHAWPHVPQLLASVLVSRHVPEQLVSPVPHDTTHAPAEHTCPDGHACAQEPQLALSVLVSRQTPEQLVSPVLHDTTHAPAVHT